MEPDVPLSDEKITTKPPVISNPSNIFEKKCSALPSPSANNTLEWQNLNVFIGQKQNEKQILYNCNGTVLSGELTAVMGGSGAGKSTLLNALSGRTNLHEQYIEGDMAINNNKFKCWDQKLIKSICTYVPQSDVLCPTQTVEEALLFYAKLKLPHYTSERQQKRINYLIDVLHLHKCRNNYIGSESKRGISGGEKRRVSIAAEILNDTDIIFLDEPTSGLDAYTAARVIKTLKHFCTVSNKIIIAVIHQPSVEVFYLFDNLILLSNGKCCFNSDIQHIDTYFKDTLRPKTNPADEIVFGVQRTSDEYVSRWEKSSLNINGMKIWDKYKAFKLSDPTIELKQTGKMAPRIVQYKLLLKRELRALIRDKRVTFIRLAEVIFFAVVCGAIFFNLSETLKSRISCFIFLAVIPILFGMVSLLTVFPQQKILFNREYDSNTYSITTWALTFTIIEIPRETIHMLLFTTIIYIMINFNGNFLQYWLTLFLASFSGGTCGLLIGTVCRTTIEAAQAVPIAFIPILIFADLIVPLNNFPDAIVWIAKINPMYYIVRCFYIIEFFGVNFPNTISGECGPVGEMCDAYAQYVEIVEANNATIPPLDDINKFLPEMDKLNTMCSDTMSYKMFFKRKELDVSDLPKYWINLVIICFVLRLISVFILWIINNNGFSWMYSKFKMIICMRKYNKVPNKSEDDADELSNTQSQISLTFL